MGAFAGLGLHPGSKLGVLSRNRPEVLEAFFAAAKAGVVLVPLNFRLQAQEFRFVINDAKLHALIVGPDYREVIASIAGEIEVAHLIDLEREYEHLLASHAPQEPEIQASGEDLFALFYTSGTTGGPKGVMLTHDNFSSAALNHLIAYQLGPADVCLHVMPIYHTYAHPAVVECAVIGVADARWGEQVCAVVVRKPATQVDAATLIAWCTERLARYKVPRRVQFTDALPRDPVGKIQKRLIRELYAGEPS